MKKRIISLILCAVLAMTVLPIGALAAEESVSDRRGWSSYGRQWYYFGSDGEMHFGWLKDNGKWYYMFDENIRGPFGYYDQTGDYWGGGQDSGEMLDSTFIWDEDGYVYYLGADGAMVTGTKVIDGRTYTFDRSGRLQQGWVKNTVTLCDDSDGILTTISRTNIWMYVKDGKLLENGWVKDNGKWYYIEDYAMVAGRLVSYNGAFYYLKANGAMAANETVTVTVDATGKLVW